MKLILGSIQSEFIHESSNLPEFELEYHLLFPMQEDFRWKIFKQTSTLEAIATAS